jgi:peroxiredoxin
MLAANLVLSVCSTLALAPIGAAAPGDDAAPVHLDLTARDGMKAIGYYAPLRVELSETKPDSLRLVPPDLGRPLYGVITISGRQGAIYHVVVDEPEGKPSRLFVDANGNGDLTDDAAAEWAASEPRKNKSGQNLTMYMGGAMVDLGAEGQPFTVHLAMYRFDPSDADRPQLKNTLLYYRDYCRQGEVAIGETSYKAVLSDELATGDFRGAQDASKPSGAMLLLDVNKNGRFDNRGESFDVRKPFNIGGVTYEISDLTRDGSSFRIVKSSQVVAEIPTPPDHTVGKPITPFEAVTMDGKTVHFPGDYKGKVVMLDFWATWCSPCMAEVPNVVAAYQKLHDRGYEILGVSLDKKDQDANVKDTLATHNMTWPQIYDGGFWQAKVAQAYAIQSIPAAFLVDGDTGKILATDVRGDKLEPAITNALANKGK